jgi:hypothetical protein
MTPEERLDRIEQALADRIEQFGKEQQENREFIRRIAEDGRTQATAFRAEAAERDRAWHAELAERNRAWREEVAERDAKIDGRISELVGAIMELVRK